MRLLADESCDFAVVRSLRRAGHDVVAVVEAMPGAHDEKVIAEAIRESRLLLTEDKDFGQLTFASSKKPPGVILIRFPGHARQALAPAVVETLARHAERLAGSFVILEPGRLRVTPFFSSE